MVGGARRRSGPSASPLPEPGSVLARVDEIPEPGALSVVIGAGPARCDIVICRHGGVLRAYLNSCPHAGTPLEGFDGRFLDREDAALMVCSTHGARFRVGDGVCIRGPCRGASLKAVAISVEDGIVTVA